ncbi:MAG: transaldolase [Planctomycetota bacterium]|jgi:transaldolase
MSNTIEKLYELGQSIWCDNISRGMIDTGELQRLIDLGVVGVTSNPTIFLKAVTGGSDYDELFNELLAEGLETQAIYEGLVLPDIADAADILRPVYERTNGVDGYVSLEVDPKLAYDTEATVAEARRLFNTLSRPNVFIKVPGTEEGIPAVETLIAEGVNVNVTLIFGIDIYMKVVRAYMNGVRRYAVSGGDPSMVASVASFFVSRVDTLVDKLLEKHGTGRDVDHLFGKAAIANARLAYACFEEVFTPEGEFAELAARGARVQRPLWASTSTKNPAYPDTIYVDGLVGPQTVNTLPPATIEAALNHGKTDVTIDEDLDEARAVLMELANLDIDIHAVTDKLRVDGVDLFARSFNDLLSNLESKRSTLRAAT